MRRGQRKIPETDAWVRGIYRVKYENSAGGGALSLHLEIPVLRD
jgi:hypothetical protein